MAASSFASISSLLAEDAPLLAPRPAGSPRQPGLNLLDARPQMVSGRGPQVLKSQILGGARHLAAGGRRNC
eukprot:1967608-Pyramimonas_sp.AAC.1